MIKVFAYLVVWLSIASNTSSRSGLQTKPIAHALPGGVAAPATAKQPGRAAPKQQAPAPKQDGPGPHRPPKPLPMPTEAMELPEDITLNSICLLDNIYGSPVVFQAELRGSTPQQISYLDKTVVDVPPNVTRPVIFSIWLKNKRTVRIRCSLSRGGSYQIFIKKNTQQLAVAPVVGG